MQKKILSTPYIIWMLLFTIVPLLLVLYYSFTTADGAQGGFTLENYTRFFDPVYLKVLWRSVVLAFIATVGCLVLGYPLASILASKDFAKKRVLIMLFVMPMWLNMMLRTYAWMTILEKHGIINTFLGWFGVEPVQFLYTNAAVVLGMIYNFLPFMVLPIYSAMIKMDYNLIEAAEDLGANRLQIFRKIKWPLSLPGISSGIIMVFMPAMSTFVITRLLGGGQMMLVGNLIEQQFLWQYDWNFGSSVSMIMMALIIISTAIFSYFGGEKGGKGGLLW